MMTALALVGCGKVKLAHAARADKLYTGGLFRAHLRFAERFDAGEVCILSARHGVLERDRVIEPYEQRLLDLSPERRREWAREVARAIEQRVVEGGVVYLLAGGDYSTMWPWMIGRRTVIVPFARASLFERLAAARRADEIDGPLTVGARVLVRGRS